MSSDGTGADIQTVEVGPGSASGSRFSATASQPASGQPSETSGQAAPMMLGVGVKAEDIARPE